MTAPGANAKRAKPPDGELLLAERAHRLRAPGHGAKRVDGPHAIDGSEGGGGVELDPQPDEMLAGALSKLGRTIEQRQARGGVAPQRDKRLDVGTAGARPWRRFGVGRVPLVERRPGGLDIAQARLGLRAEQDGLPPTALAA